VLLPTTVVPRQHFPLRADHTVHFGEDFSKEHTITPEHIETWITEKVTSDKPVSPE
jgi:hypothetical protein